jgi:hypothetical protein
MAGGSDLGSELGMGLAIAATVATDGAAAPLIEEAAAAEGAGLLAGEVAPAALGDVFGSTALSDVATGVAPETWGSAAEAGVPTYTAQAAPQTANGVTSTISNAGEMPVVNTAPVVNPNALPNAVPNAGLVDTGANLPAPGTGPELNGGNPSGIKGMWDSLGTYGKMGVMGAGTAGLGYLLKQDNQKYGMPSTQTYSGPLSQFSYNPATYKPAIATPPANPYQARYAEGGEVGNVAQPNRPMQENEGIGNNITYPQVNVGNTLRFSSKLSDPQSTDMANPALASVGDPYAAAPRFAKGGGIAGAKVDNMQAIDDYAAQASQEGGLAQVMAKAKAGDYNAMIALNKLNKTPNQNYAHGGEVGHLGGYSDGGRMLKGPGDGMSDDIPATIAGKQPARLADSEFVVPADVVSHLGNGSSDAGAKKLYSMMDNVRKARTGTKKQGKQIHADKYLPK